MYRIVTKEDERDLALMSNYISRHESGHFLQSPQWAEVKENWRWYGVLAYDRSGRVCGAMSVLVRRLAPGLRLMYAPRGPVCDRSDAAVVTELLRGARDIARRLRVPLFLLDPDEPDGSGPLRAAMTAAGFEERGSTGFDNIQAQYVFRLDLYGRTEEEVLAAFSSKTRYNIRLAGRRGVTVRSWRGDEAIPPAALDEFYRLMRVTGERDRFLVRDRAYYARVLRALGRGAVLFLAEVDGQAVAATVGVYYDRKAWYLYGASANEHREAMPNYLLQWEMIRRALRLRCSFYDFRGVPGDPSKDDPLYGLYRFKRGFSGDYIKFTGLFIKRYEPLLGGALLRLWSLYRRLRLRRLRPRTLLLAERPHEQEERDVSAAG